MSVSSDTEPVSTSFGKVRHKKTAEQKKQSTDSEKSGPSSFTESDIPNNTRKSDVQNISPVSDPGKSVTRAKRKPKKSGVRPRTASGKSGPVVLNFDNADLQEVIRTLAELLNISYIVEPGIRGAVTIHTAGELKKEDLFPVFFQILEANSLTAIKEGSLYKIIRFRDASRMPIVSRSGEPEKYAHPEERIIIQIIPLKFISVQEMTKLLTPFISAEGTVISHGDSNTLLLVDKRANILKVLRLADVFDVNVFEKVSHRFYPLEYLDAKETVRTLTDVIASYGTAKGEVRLTAIERLNTLLAVSSNPLILRKIHEFIQEIDIPVHDTEARIYVYSVKNGEAEELSGILDSVFTGKTSEKEKTVISEKGEPEKKSEAKSVKTPFGTIIREKGKKPGAEKQSDLSGSTTLKEEIRITPDKTRNALIIEAIPADYRIVESLLKRLDVLPRQVLIELTLAELTLDNTTDLGIEWRYNRNSGTGEIAGKFPFSSLTDAGLQFMIGRTRKWEAKLSAFAKNKKVNILSSPSVLASDNKEAKINISTEIPVESVEYKGTESNIVETSIQYRNTGIILSVTPHINEHGLVSMDVNQEISEKSGSESVGGKSAASFYKRSVNTTLTVKHGQTIVIGGLMKQTKTNEALGTPCLVNMPVINYLFGKKVKSGDKTELIIFITPHVITSLDDVDAVTREFKSKLRNATIK